ncbi:MAG: hypothetical protein ACXVCV_02385 [Polyangia bacterium]
MTRALVVSLALAAGCNSPVCGAGTMQVQLKNGTLECQPVAALPDTIACDVDAGAELLGGACVSRIQCGSGTALDEPTGTCVATGQADPCPTPASGTICVSGTLHHFVDGSPLAGGETVRVGIADPLSYLGGGQPIAEIDSTGTFVFKDVPAPVSGSIAIGAGDQAGTPNVIAATAAPVAPGKSYRIDGYVLPRAVVDDWKEQTGVDYVASGAYVAGFYADRPTSPTDFTQFETTPVTSVQLLEDGAVPTRGVKYFGTSLMTVDSTLTATGARGTALLAAQANIHSYSGMGGTAGGTPIVWPTVSGGSSPGVVFLSRFHPM